VYVCGRDAIGLPVSAGLRADSIRLFPELAGLHEVAETLHWENGGTGRMRNKLLVPPALLAHSMGSSVMARAPICGIIELRLDAARSGASLTCVPRARRSSVIERYVLADPLHHDAALRANLGVLGLSGSLDSELPLFRLTHDGVDRDAPFRALRAVLGA
jgi:hypothetical protein